ncbi:MAG: hypothetical protein QOE75_2154 [Solirubrobacterales bacterium]|nr:hypothetical protein [Solirubrobacterales bacterium]
MEHFEVLRMSVEQFTQRDRKDVQGQFDEAASQYVFKVPLEGIHSEWPLWLGDFVYDMRASLDYLVTALIRSTGNEESEASQFPIYGIDRIAWQDVDEHWEGDPRRRIARSLKGTPDGTKAALKPLQPFFGVPRTDPPRHPLFALQVLSNRDKHRRLNLLAHRAKVEFVDADGRPLFRGPPAHGRIAGRQEAGEYIATLATNRKHDGDVWLRHSYDVQLDEPPELVGDLIEALSSINQFIDARVVPSVTGLLAS